MNEAGELVEKKVSKVIEVEKPLMEKIKPYFFKKFLFLTTWQIILILLFLMSSALAYHEYEVYEEKKKKYNIKVDFSQLPQPSDRSAFIGKIAETDIRTFLDMDKLQTHSIVAGATGGGKTVAAQVIVEEALNKGVSVIVFDPTAQWTGFLRKCEDRRMLAIYKNFSMRKTDAKAFNGNVHQILDARQIIDIKKYVSTGEINIFAINRLDPKDIDIFVANTIREVFHANLDESQELKLLIVYDEVHRLLPKFGGSGEGFIQIERACREFRKWGVGLVLISQVLTDFVGEIKANISTEIQVRTRDEGDLNRIKTKYGEDILSSVVRASVGTGMLENPAYNKGNPYLVSFRPLLHSTTRLSDDELGKHNKYNDKIEDLSYQLDQLEELKVDVFDIKLELKLALDKVKSGNFNMVDIYLDSLEPRVREQWQKIGKTPKKRELKLASSEDIKADIEKAKKARSDYLSSLKNRKKAAPTVEEEAH
jgi:hypothetical protein